MATMLVTYQTPADPAAFDNHYFSVHVPLAKKLPGLRKYQVSKGPITGRPAGVSTYMVATLSFDSMADIRTAFASDIGQACAADIRHFAPNDTDSTMRLFEDAEL